jgi:hypothetical protein
MMNMSEEENIPLLTRSTENPGKGHTAVMTFPLKTEAFTS